MNKDEMLKIVTDSFGELKSTIAEAAEQLFNTSMQAEFVEDQIALQNVFEEKGQHVCAFFKTKASSYEFGHLFLFSPELASQLYAWMIGAEPEAELNEEQLEGLKEATDQIFGRIKMAITSDDAPAIDALTIFEAGSFDNLSEFLGDVEGHSAKFFLEFKEKSFEMIYHFLPIEYEQSMEENTNMENSDDVDVQSAEFEAMAGKSLSASSPKNIDMLMDVELEVSVELGRKPVLISDVLKLGKGSILELEKSAGENLDIIVNGKKLAEGEVVVIDEHFGIRITQLVSPKDRVQLLQ